MNEDKFLQNLEVLSRGPARKAFLEILEHQEALTLTRLRDTNSQDDMLRFQGILRFVNNLKKKVDLNGN